MTPTSTEMTWLQGVFQDMELSSVFTLMSPELASVQLIRVRGETVQVVGSPERTWQRQEHGEKKQSLVPISPCSFTKHTKPTEAEH